MHAKVQTADLIGYIHPPSTGTRDLCILHPSKPRPRYQAELGQWCQFDPNISRRLSDATRADPAPDMEPAGPAQGLS